MSYEPKQWDKSGGTASLCDLDEIPEWIENYRTAKKPDEMGPIVAGVFLKDANEPNETYVADYTGYLLPATKHQAAARATHLAFRPIDTGGRNASALNADDHMNIEAAMRALRELANRTA